MHKFFFKECASRKVSRRPRRNMIYTTAQIHVKAVKLFYLGVGDGAHLVFFLTALNGDDSAISLMTKWKEKGHQA